MTNKKAVEEKIAQVAYTLFEKRGMEHGCHMDDWLLAEKIVMAELANKPESEGTSKAPRKKAAASKTAAKKPVATAEKVSPIRKRTGRKKSTSTSPES